MSVAVRTAHPAEFLIRDRRTRQAGLDLDEIVEIQERHKNGWQMAALMRAYGVSRRTIYRYLAGELITVNVGIWRATFFIRADHVTEPRRCSQWVAFR